MTRLVQSLERLNLQPADLEWVKKHEIISQLEADGYEVIDAPSGADAGFDLMAVKDQKKLAIEIKSSTRLPDAAEEIKRLRERALEMGLDEFRVILVSPPRQRNVEIYGLEMWLETFLSEPHVHEELQKLASYVSVIEVAEVDIESVEVTQGAIRVKGDAVVYTKLEYGERLSNGLSVDASIPFTFDIALDHDLKLDMVHEIKFDTSGWD